jgi:hypothetical protein
VEFNVEFLEFSGPTDQSAREIRFLEDFSQRALGKNLDGVSLEVRFQSSGRCHKGKG